MMNTEVTPDRIVATAAELDQDEFTRAQLADELGVKPRELRDGLKAARRSGRLEKVGEDDRGKGLFRLTGE
jgi:hypothetical protein